MVAELNYTDAWYTLGGMLSITRTTDLSYTPYGEQIGERLSGFGYNGELYDAATGSLYLRARNYEPAMNRFSQKDILRGTVAEPTSLNRYLYVGNDPLNLIDPTGEAQRAIRKTAKTTAGRRGTSVFGSGVNSTKNRAKNISWNNITGVTRPATSTVSTGLSQNPPAIQYPSIAGTSGRSGASRSTAASRNTGTSSAASRNPTTVAQSSPSVQRVSIGNWTRSRLTLRFFTNG